MAEFRFTYPIRIRYGDLDPQWHLNNARYLTFCEAARMHYLQALGLWDGQDFFKLGAIVAEARITFRAPLQLGQVVEVRMRVSRLGGKSFTTEYELVEQETGLLTATAEIVMVHYNYHTNLSEPLPDHWRQAISAYEGIPAR